MTAEDVHATIILKLVSHQCNMYLYYVQYNTKFMSTHIIIYKY